MINNHESIIQKILLLISVLMTAATLYIGYLIIFPLDPLNVTNIQLQETRVRAGDDITYSIDYCKSVDAASTINISIVNAQVIALTPIQSGQTKGCSKNVTRTVTIPKNANTGVHHLEIDVTYDFNPLHKYVYHYSTPEFWVDGNNDN